MNTSDLISATYFVPLTSTGWWQLFAESYGGLKLLWIVAGFTIFLCFISYEVVLRAPVRVENFMHSILVVKLTPEMLAEERVLRAHKHRCKTRSARWVKRRNRINRRGAVQRRQKKRRETSGGRIEKIVVRLVGAYTSTPSWLSAFFASASLFVAVFTILDPGPVGVLILFSPFVLVGPIDIIREHFLRR